MLEEITALFDIVVYTNNGVAIGRVSNVVLDIEKSAIDGLYIDETNPALVEGAQAITVPYRWIQSVGDVIILRHFPERVFLEEELSSRIVPTGYQPGVR